MYFSYVTEGDVVTGLNREGYGDELTGTCTPQDLVWGMVPEYYTAPGGTLTPKTAGEVEEVQAEKQKEANSNSALASQNQALKEIEESNLRVASNLPPLMSFDDKIEMENYVQEMQGEVDNPTEDPVYNPPLPPGVTPPSYASFTITVTREPGWQGNLGYKVELNSSDPAFVPGNMALATYTNPDCEDYILTTGAFVETEGVWGAVCPAGHEPGDVDINFGILYGAAPMSCWTMEQGRMVQTVNAYEDI